MQNNNSKTQNQKPVLPKLSQIGQQFGRLVFCILGIISSSIFMFILQTSSYTKAISTTIIDNCALLVNSASGIYTMNMARIQFLVTILDAISMCISAIMLVVSVIGVCTKNTNGGKDHFWLYCFKVILGYVQILCIACLFGNCVKTTTSSDVLYSCVVGNANQLSVLQTFKKNMYVLIFLSALSFIAAVFYIITNPILYRNNSYTTGQQKYNIIQSEHTLNKEKDKEHDKNIHKDLRLQQSIQQQPPSYDSFDKLNNPKKSVESMVRNSLTSRQFSPHKQLQINVNHNTVENLNNVSSGRSQNTNSSGKNPRIFNKKFKGEIYLKTLLKQQSNKLQKFQIKQNTKKLVFTEQKNKQIKYQFKEEQKQVQQNSKQFNKTSQLSNSNQNSKIQSFDINKLGQQYQIFSFNNQKSETSKLK